MIPKIDPTKTSAWKALTVHYSMMKEKQMKDLFQQDPDRFAKFSINFGDLLFDYSKNIVTQETIGHFLQLADECQWGKYKRDRGPSCYAYRAKKLFHRCDKG
jgi:glucose-6-phosphate isomerase